MNTLFAANLGQPIGVFYHNGFAGAQQQQQQQQQ
jgi:hypothetical protein